MPTAAEAHLILITDLLSHGELPQGTFPSIAHHVAILDDAALLHLVSTLLTSNSLWHSRPASDIASSSSSSSSPPSLSFRRARDLFASVQYGMMTRIETMEAVHGSGWLARRKLGQSLRSIWKAMQYHKTEESVHPLCRVILASGVSRAFEELASKESKLAENATSLRRAGQDAVVSSWDKAAPFARGDLASKEVNGGTNQEKPSLHC